MRTPQIFNQIIRDQLRFTAAWLPITNTFKIGDYGILSDGIFTAIGNISHDFGLKPQIAAGESSKLSFATKGTTFARIAADATVNAFPDSDAEAKLKIGFKDESSFFLRAKLTLNQMQNINEIAYGLYHNRDWQHWRYKYRVVTGAYVGKDAAIISSIGKDSSIELTGKASALKQLDIGGAAANVDVANRNQIGLELIGKTGVVGLSFFKLRWYAGADPKTLSKIVLPQEVFSDPADLEKDDV